jgi:hypothetical protein
MMIDHRSWFVANTSFNEPRTTNEIMFKKLYLAFGIGVILLYSVFTWFGWELFNSGSRSRTGSPFIWLGGGYRGGK